MNMLSLISLYNQQAEQYLADAIQLKSKITDIQNEDKLIGLKEEHLKKMIELYKQRVSSYSQDYSYLIEIQKLQSELQSLSFGKERNKINIVYSYERVASRVENALKNAVQSLSISIQNKDMLGMQLSMRTLNSIMHFIEQSRSDRDLYEKIVSACRSINSSELMRLSYEQDIPFSVKSVIYQIQNILNSYPL